MKALTRTLHITEKDIAIVVAVKCAVVIVSTPVVSFSFKKIGHRQCKLKCLTEFGSTGFLNVRHENLILD